MTIFDAKVHLKTGQILDVTISDSLKFSQGDFTEKVMFKFLSPDKAHAYILFKATILLLLNRLDKKYLTK